MTAILFLAGLTVLFFAGVLIGMLVGVLFYIAGIKRGIGYAMHDALVFAGALEGETNELLHEFLERAKTEAMKPKPYNPRDEWEAEKKRLHDAGIT
jgi:hypothetical protein